MAQRYVVGQEVRVKLVRSPTSSPRDSSIEPYAGKVGKITNYYWIRPPVGGVFYTYMVRFEVDGKQIVLHEDEIEASM